MSTPEPDPPTDAEAPWSAPRAEPREEGGDPACWAHLFDEAHHPDRAGAAADVEGIDGDP